MSKLYEKNERNKDSKFYIKYIVGQESFKFVLSTIFSTCIVIIKEVAKISIAMGSAALSEVIVSLFGNFAMQTAYIIIENICLAIMIWGMVIICENIIIRQHKDYSKYASNWLFYLIFLLYIVYCIACATMGIYKADKVLIICMGIFALFMAILLIYFLYKSNVHKCGLNIKDDRGCISAS